jgi:hypothetical protein
VSEDDGAAVGLGVGEQAWIGAPEGEHGLVGVAGEDELLGGEPEAREQAVLQRVEVLGVVDEQVADAVPFRGEELLVGLEGEERGGDQLRGVEGRGGLLGDRAVRGVREEVDLLVLAGELADRDPFGVFGVLADLDELLGAEAALGGAEHEVAELLGETRHGERGPEAVGPVVGLVLDVAGEQLADHGVLFWAGEQARAGDVT